MPRGQSIHESENLQSGDPTVLGKNYNPFRSFDCMPGTALNAVCVLLNLAHEGRISTTTFNKDMITVGQGADWGSSPKINTFKSLQKTVNTWDQRCRESVKWKILKA